MRSLIYLSSRRVKNKLLELLHKPGKLILSLMFVTVLVMNLSIERISASGSRPISEFYAIVFAFYIICFVTQVSNGFSRGGAIFTLSDVSFLFMSPVKPTAVLFHGMMGRLGTSLWMGLAFVYQFSLLRSFYPVGVRDMFVAVIGYGAIVFLSQLAGMLVYFFSCGDEIKTTVARRVLYALIFVFAVLLAAECDFGSFGLTSVSESLTRPAMMLFPVAGWVFAIVKGVLEGKAAIVTAGAVVSVVFVAATFVILSVSKHGYYEDVLITAEKNAELSESGRVTVRRRKAKSVSGGIGKGKGVSVFYHKHRLENRRSGTSLFSSVTFYYLLLIGVYGFVFRSDAATLFILSCMIGIHTVLSGRWLKELTMPWIYTVPGSPSGKLFFILPELLPKVIAESILQGVLIAFICKSETVMTAVFILARISFCFLLTASALFTSKIMREREKSNVFVMLCMFFGMLFSVPSLVAVFGLLYFGMGTVIAFVALTAVNTVAGFAVLFMSRNLLRAGA